MKTITQNAKSTVRLLFAVKNSVARTMCRILTILTVIFFITWNNDALAQEKGKSKVQVDKVPYKMAIGINALSTEAVSFKMFLSPKLTFQVELGYKWTVTSVRTSIYDYYSGYSYNYRGSGYIGTLELNPNLFYQQAIKDWKFARLDWLAGGGVSIGYAFGSRGKFGINAGGGAELIFHKIPLAVQMDFRPGYGMLFGRGAQYFYSDKKVFSYFDWGLNISARYLLN
jgi:hypothetical protein